MLTVAKFPSSAKKNVIDRFLHYLVAEPLPSEG
jgi:hypothetical protein